MKQTIDNTQNIIKKDKPFQKHLKLNLKETQESKNYSEASFNKSTHRQRHNTQSNNIDIKPYQYKPIVINKKNLKGNILKTEKQINFQNEVVPLKVIQDNQNWEKVQTLSKAWNYLENKVDFLQEEIDKLNKDKSMLINDYHKLLIENKKIEKTSENYKHIQQKDEIIKTLQKYITKMNELLTELNKENQSIKENNSKLLNENKELKHQLEELIKLLNEIQQQNNITKNNKLESELDKTNYVVKQVKKKKEILCKKVNEITLHLKSDLKNKKSSFIQTILIDTTTSFTIKTNKVKQLKSKYKIENVLLLTIKGTILHKKKEKSVSTLKEHNTQLQKESSFLKEQNIRLLKDSNQQKDKNIQLQKEAHHLKEQNILLKKQSNQFKEQNTHLQTELIQLKEENINSLKELTELKEQNTTLQREIGQIQNEFNTLKEESHNDIVNLNKELVLQRNNTKKIQTSLNQSEDLHKALINERERLNDKIFDLINQNNNLQSKNQELISLNNELSNKNSFSESEIKTLKSKIQNFEKIKSQSLERNKTQENDKISTLQKENKRLCQNLDKNEEILKSRESHINKLTNQINSLKTEIEKEVNENTQLKDEILELLSNDEKMANDLLNLNSLKTDLQSKLSLSQTQLNSLQNQNDTLNKENTNLQKHTNKLQQELNINKEEITKMKTLLDEKEKRHQYLLDLLLKLNSLNFNNLETKTENTINEDLISKFDTLINLFSLSIAEYNELNSLAKVINDYKEILLILNEEKDKNDSLCTEIEQIKQQNFDLISQQKNKYQQTQNIEDFEQKLLINNKYINKVKSSKISVDDIEYEELKLRVTTLQNYIKEKEQEIISLKDLIKKEKEQAMILKIKIKQMQIELDEQVSK